jgi:hypothetical protein
VRRVVLVLCLTLATCSVLAVPAPRLIVEAPPRFAAQAARVRALADGDFSSSLRLTGMDDFGPPIAVVLAAEDSSAARQVPPWASGFTVGGRGLIVLFPQRVPSYPDRNLEALLHHEVTHVLVARATRGRPVPHWFNEGLATVAAREWGLEDRARSAAALIGKGPRSTAELDAAFGAPGTASARRAYALSAALMRSLLRRFGDDMPGRVLHLVGRDVPFPRAFHEVTGSDVERAVSRYFVKEAFWYTWVPFVTSSGALWMAITLLAIVAIRRRRQRSAAMHARWEAEDERARLEAERRARGTDTWTIN